MVTRPSCRLLLLLAAAALLRYPASADASPPGTPRAEISEAVHNFGSVMRGEKVRQGFTIRNTGSGDLVVGDVELFGAGDATIRLRKTIPAGQAGEVTLILDTTRLSGEVEAGAAFSTNDPEHSRVELSLTGRVKQLVDVLPFSAVYIAAFKNVSAEGSVTIVNNDNVPLRITGIEPRSDLFRAELDTVKEGAEYRLRVVSNPEAPPGRHKERVTLRTTNRRVPQLSVVVNLLVRNRVYAFPDEIDFGTVDREELARRPALAALLTQTVLVKRRAGDDFRIEIEGAVPFVRVVKSPPEGSATYRLEVSLVPEKLTAGRIDGTLRVRTNDAEFPEIAIPIKGEVI